MLMPIVRLLLPLLKLTVPAMSPAGVLLPALKLLVVYAVESTGKVTATEMAAATYGPTNGPPPPTGGEPTGSTASTDVSAIARARLRRPLPVWSELPAASAFRARRPTMTPLLANESFAFSSAAAPATSAAAADVPLIVA